MGTEHFLDTNDHPHFQIVPYKVASYNLPAVQEENQGNVRQWSNRP